MGNPDRIICDRVTCFTATRFKTICQDHGAHLTLNSSRHPQENGQVERVNRTLITTLSISAEDQIHWDKKLKYVERYLNTAVNKTTGETRIKLLHGYSPKFNFNVINLLSLTSDEWTEPENLQIEARARIEQQQKKMKEYYDLKHYGGLTYNLGEVVAIQRQPVQGESTKLQRKYHDRPMQVVELLPGDTDRVVELGSEGKRSYSTTAHISQLKM